MHNITDNHDDGANHFLFKTEPIIGRAFIGPNKDVVLVRELYVFCISVTTVSKKSRIYL